MANDSAKSLDQLVSTLDCNIIKVRDDNKPQRYELNDNSEFVACDDQEVKRDVNWKDVADDWQQVKSDSDSGKDSDQK